MAVGALQKICGTTIEISEARQNELIRESEQLRILTNFIKLDEVTNKRQALLLIKAMEVQNGK